MRKAHINRNTTKKLMMTLYQFKYPDNWEEGVQNSRQTDKLL